MLKKACVVCQVLGTLAGIGALNWGLIALFNINVVESIFGIGTLTRIIYILVGASGLAVLASFFGICPKCK